MTDTFPIRLPGMLYAALQVCHHSLPDWINKSTPRCAVNTRLAALQLTAEQAVVLDDLVAHAWWECVQDGDPGNPFVRPLAAACEAYFRTGPTPPN